jgi:hypothetical protein
VSDPIDPQDDQEVDGTDEPSGEPSADADRRSRWIAAGVFGVAVVGLGLVALAKSDTAFASLGSGGGGLRLPSVPSPPSLASTGGGRTLDHLVNVREHVRQQPYGVGRELRKQIVIAAHTRGPQAAA